MKVSRQMLHEDLQPADVYRMQTLPKYLYRYKWSTRLAHSIIHAQLAKRRGDSNLTMSTEERYLPTSDGDTKIRAKIYRPRSLTAEECDKLPAMLYLHGGGYITGAPEPFEGHMARFVKRRPCVVVAPAYRTAFTKPYPAALDDCYMTLLWMRDNAVELGVGASKMIVAGLSAGGGLAAAVTLKARDTGDVKVAFQMPFYPMIDDQQPSDPARYIDVVGWDTRNNAFGWASYLKDLHENGLEIPAYAAPARNSDYSGFPPTITFVGEFEPFYWETVEYVRRLKAADVDVAFKVYEKCTHGPDMIVPNSSLGKDAIAFSLDSYADFYDRYVADSSR